MLKDKLVKADQLKVKIESHFATARQRFSEMLKVNDKLTVYHSNNARLI
jgi:hypothetical protein